MRQFTKARVGIALLMACASTAVTSQEPARSDLHVELATALTPPHFVNSLTDAFLEAMSAQMRADAELVALDADCEGLFDVANAALREAIKEPQASQLARHREELSALLRSEMPADQAAEAVGFYRSDFVRGHLERFGENVAYDATARSILGGGSEEEAQAVLDGDIATAQRTAGKLFEGADDLHRELSQKDWFRTMLRIQPEIQRLRKASFAGYTPEQNAAIDAHLSERVLGHATQCFAEGS